MAAFDEDLHVTFHHNLYAGIDPGNFAGSAAGKVHLGLINSTWT
jgi:hypothetical protein